MAQEKTFENKIKKYLKDNECYFVKYFANRMTKVGVPDILASVNGHFVGIEVKATTGKPSELQIWNVKQINLSMGIGVIVYPNQFSQLKELINALLDGDSSRAYSIADSINISSLNERR